MSNHKLEGKFNPKDFEERLYKEWEEKGYFKPSMDEKKDRLISISADGNVDDEELEEFYNIQVELNQMSELIDTLKIWTNKMIYDGKIDEKRYEEVAKKHANLQK